MPMITVDYPQGKLSSQQKDVVAEDLTQVILQIEGGADTPQGRSIAWVKFNEVDGSNWYIGGTANGEYEAPAGKFLIELNVPEGSMDQDRKSQCHEAITKVFMDVTGTTETKGAARSIWIQIVEWPEGHLATSGRTSSFMGIAKKVGIPADHPMLEFPRAYFDAKDRLFDQAGFPKKTAGRAIVRY